MTNCPSVLIIFCVLAFVTSQIEISRWKYYQQVATLSSKEEIVLSHSRVSCATFCDHRNCDSFLYGDNKKCQLLDGKVDKLELQKGEIYEHWIRSDLKTQGSNVGTLFVYSEEYLYWYDISTRERIAKLKHEVYMSHCEYDMKRRNFFWAESDGPMKLTRVSLGKTGPVRRILRRPVGNFCIDFDKNLIFFSNAAANANGDFVRYSRKTKQRKILVKNTSGDFKMWCCTLDTSKQYIFYGESYHGITRINYNGGDGQFIQKTDVNTIFFNQDDQTLYWIEEYDSDEGDGELSRITYRSAYGLSVTKRIDLYMDECYSIYVKRNVIYYKTNTARGVSVATLDGTQLPAIGTMEIGSEDEPYMFLFT